MGNPKKSKKASIPVRIVLVTCMTVFALMLIHGVLVDGSPFSAMEWAKSSGGTTGTSTAPEMHWIAIPVLLGMSYWASKAIIKDIEAKKKEKQ